MRFRTLMLAVPLALVAGCSGSGRPAAYDVEDDGSTYDSQRQHSDWQLGAGTDFDATVNLPDGRKVSMFYAKKRGLAEQHYSPEADAWTAPRIIYRTKTDPCQGISLETAGGTVVVNANWNIYCYDGEPPDESVAGVAIGDLTRWDTNLTRHFDGWGSPTLSDDGDRASWHREGDRLTWSYGDGFDREMAGD